MTRETGQVKTKKLTKQQLLQKLPANQRNTFKSKSIAQLQEICQGLNLQTEVQEVEVEEGWLGKPKGLFQALWERGWIDPNNLDKYVKNRRVVWMDASGKSVRDECLHEYQKYSMTYLMGECSDFKTELSAMEKLAHDLSARHDCNMAKYHCEMAGEGIEYSWRYAKKEFCSLNLNEKKGKDNFIKCVKRSLKKVSADLMRKFSARARRYMLTYRLFDIHGEDAEFDSLGLSYKEIEKYVTTKMKTHRCAFDLDHRWISRIWRESQQIVR